MNENWALITGSSSGIGKELAISLAKRNWNLILVARREPLLAQIKKSLTDTYKVKVEYIAADITSDDEILNIKKKIEKHNVSLIINNAGILNRSTVKELVMKEVQKLHKLNIESLTQLSIISINHFSNLSKPCYLLNVGSVNSYVALSKSSIYSGSKAYVKAFSLALREEVSDTNITVSCLCPGGTESEILEAAGVGQKVDPGKFLMSGQAVAEIAIKGLFKNQAIIIPGMMNKLTILLNRILPEWLVTKVSSKIMSKFIG